MSERLKSVKIPFTAWQALTRICAATGAPRTRQLAKIIHEAERQQVASQQQKGSEECEAEGQRQRQKDEWDRHDAEQSDTKEEYGEEYGEDDYYYHPQ